MKNDTVTMLVEKIRASYPALYMVSSEYQRSLGEIQKAAVEVKRDMFVWTMGRNLVKVGDKPQEIEDTAQPPEVLLILPKMPEKSIVVLQIFNHFLTDPQLQSILISVLPEFKVKKKTLIILTPVLAIPPELEKEFSLVEPRLPDKETLNDVLNGIINSTPTLKNEGLDDGTRKALVESAMGLTTSESENAFSLALIRPKMQGSKERWDPKVVMEEKMSVLKKSGLLEYIPLKNNGLDQIGGLENLKEWISMRKKAFTDEARAFGLPNPKGILLIGPPGTGKTASAKAISNELRIPLLKCDLGKVYAGLVGASEANMRQVIQTAEAVAPCVLILDEADKQLAGNKGSGDGDSGVSKRIFGQLLSWMSDKETPVFIVATVNSVNNIPPEYLRAGRFDGLFSVLLPNATERKEIFSIHIKKKGREHLINKLDIDDLVNRSEGFSGAEIEACIVDAMYRAFNADKDLNMFDLQEAVADVVPLSTTMKAAIDEMTEWCKNKTKPASKQLQAQKVTSGRLVDA